MSLRIAIVTDDAGWHGARLREVFAARGCTTGFVSLRRCGLDLSAAESRLILPGFEGLPDGVFVRGVPGGSLQQVVFHLDVLHALKRLGVPVYNDGGAIERSVDKGMTSFLLDAAGIPTPPAWVASDPGTVRRIVERELGAGHELVLKPLFGSQGEGLSRIRDSEALPGADDSDGVYYLQRFIPTGRGDAEDWRVLVIGGEAVAGMRRTATGWITNVARGGRCHPAAVDAELRRLAEAAVAALDMGYAGVDILRDAEGNPYVIEVNSIPAWKGLQQVCTLDLADALVGDFLRHCAAPPRMEIVF